MRRFLAGLFFAMLLSGCELWIVQPQPFPVWSPIPSRTPEILSPTPLIAPGTAGELSMVDVGTSTPIPAAETATPAVGSAVGNPSLTPNRGASKKVDVEILGCETGFDVTHGMHEVTNAYVKIMNTGGPDLPNACGLLRAIDEDREHPDKQRCVVNLPADYQVTFRLTVDSAYKQDTAIQVDVSSEDVLLLRVSEPSCRDINLFGAPPSDEGTTRPISP